MLADDDVRRAGRRIVNQFTPSEQQGLASILDRVAFEQPAHDGSPVLDADGAGVEFKGLDGAALPQPAGATPTSWVKYIEAITDEIIARRSRMHQSVEVDDVLAEVLPVAHAALPMSARRELFERILHLTKH